LIAPLSVRLSVVLGVSVVLGSGVTDLHGESNSKGWKLTVGSDGSPPTKLLLRGLVSESDDDSLGGLKMYWGGMVQVVSLRRRSEDRG
jgi:hypothetical protein